MAPRYGDGGVKFLGGLHELGGGPGVQYLFVDDFHLSNDGRVVR